MPKKNALPERRSYPKGTKVRVGRKVKFSEDDPPVQRYYYAEVVEEREGGDLLRVLGGALGALPKGSEAVADARHTIEPVCPEMVWNSYDHSPCYRPLTKPEQREANLCGIHLGAKKRAEANIAKREEKDARQAVLRREATELADAFKELTGVRPGVGWGSNDFSFTRSGLRQLMLSYERAVKGQS